MWDMCGWSGLFVMFVFTPHVHTFGGANTGVNCMGSSDNPRAPPPYTCQQQPWASYRPLGDMCQHISQLYSQCGPNTTSKS